MSDSKAYGYAVARIRAMEPMLLDSSVYQRMLDADGVSGAIKVLGETVYSRVLGGESVGERYDSALENELGAVFDEFESFVPEKKLIELFRIQYDFHNVKVVLKSMMSAKAGGRKRWDLLTGLGTVPADKIAGYIEAEEYSYLPYGLSNAVPDSLALWEQTHDIVEVERVLDECMFQALLRTAEATGEPGVAAWIKTRIDAENVRSLVRLKRFGFEPSDAMKFMHSGGCLSMMDLSAMYTEPLENWAHMMTRSIIGDTLADLQDEGDFDKLIVDIERSLDDACQSALAKARYSTYAPENVLAYLWGKEQEMKNIRTIMVSKSTDSPTDETRRSMRHGY